MGPRLCKENMANSPSDRLAVSIDAENAQALIAAELFAEISRYGTATIKRAYGDWTTPNLRGWKEVLQTILRTITWISSPMWTAHPARRVTFSMSATSLQEDKDPRPRARGT